MDATDKGAEGAAASVTTPTRLALPEGQANAPFSEAPLDPPVPAAPTNLSAAHIDIPDSAPGVQLLWESDDDLATYWGITENGFPIGLVVGSDRSAIIHEAISDQDIEYGVVGITEAGFPGEFSTVVLPARSG